MSITITADYTWTEIGFDAEIDKLDVSQDGPNVIFALDNESAAVVFNFEDTKDRDESLKFIAGKLQRYLVRESDVSLAGLLHAAEECRQAGRDPLGDAKVLDLWAVLLDRAREDLR